MSKFTLEKCICPLFGRPSNFRSTVLPTNKAIILCCNEERHSLGKSSRINKEPKFKVISENVAQKVIALYVNASIPHVSFNRVVQKINTLHEEYIKIKSYLNNLKKKESPALRQKIDDFKSKCEQLFDISSCKCKNFEDCDCSVNERVPSFAQKFLIDQRGERKSFLRRNIFEAQLSECTVTLSPVAVQDEFSENTSCSSQHSQYTPEFNLKTEKIFTQTRVSLPKTAEVSQRYGVSDRATAAIASAVLLDHGIITCDNNVNVLDRNKIRRSKRKLNQSLIEEPIETPLKAVYFDGRKDNTLSQIKIGAKFRRSVIKEEHISCLMEPGSQYLGHFVPLTGSAQDICNELFTLLTEKGGVDNLELIACDGTVVNTGYKNGVIRRFEKMVNRPLQWIVCLLHFNELPFRALFIHIDGVTEGPNSFTGPIGKQLKNCELKTIVEFEAIDFPIPEVVEMNDLSEDQKYLLQICKAIKSGFCSLELSLKPPGTLNHSRWLTCANRILRLYVSTSEPSDELITIVNYLLNVYVPQWFSIRKNKSIKHGSRHFFEQIRLSRYLPENQRSVVDAAISRNSFFALPENILLSMMVDEDHEVRSLALQKILFARQKKQEVRCIKLPEINFNSTNYYEIIDWSVTPYNSPPVLNHISDDVLTTRLLNNEIYLDWEFEAYPCHTVAVERLVKLVTETSLKVCGQENREGYIRATLKSRGIMDKFNTKKDFVI